MMMDANRRKYVARGFMERRRSFCHNLEALKADIKEFGSESLENRQAVALGLIAIGGDESENMGNRNFALIRFAMIAHACDLRNNEELEQQLVDIIDNWVSVLFGSRRFERRPLSVIRYNPTGAIMALGQVNMRSANAKIDYLIKNVDDAEFKRELLSIRETFSRLKPPPEEKL